MISIGRPHYAVFAGLSGSAASIFGKLISHCDTFTENFPTEQEFYWNWILKIVFITLMVICNIFVWTFFVKALHEHGGSVVATVTSTATNYCFSAIVGNWIFGEQVTVLWWFGTSLVVIGLVFVSLGNKDQIENTKITETTKKTK